MTKWTTFFSGMAIASLLLTGCGTANNEQAPESSIKNESQTNSAQTEDTNTTENQSSTVQTEETSSTENQNSTAQTEEINASDSQNNTEESNASDSQNSSTEESNASDSQNSSTEESNASDSQNSAEESNASEVVNHEQASETTNEKVLQYTFNNENKEETAFLKPSDNQPFSLYVLPNFELSAEEPGKDIVFLSENDRIFMRIELLSDNVDWTKAEEDAKAFLKATSDSITEPELNIDNGVGYEVTSGNDVVTAVLLKDEKTPVRLTMFTTKDADYRHALLEMAKTIQKK